MSDEDASFSSQNASQATAVKYTECDIPGVYLDDPIDCYMMLHVVPVSWYPSPTHCKRRKKLIAW